MRQYSLRVRQTEKGLSSLELLLLVLAAAFLLTCGRHYAVALGRISQQGELSPTSLSQPINSAHSLTYEFVARSPILGKIYVFVPRERFEQSRAERFIVELSDFTNLQVLHRFESKLGEVTFGLGDALVLTPAWIVQQGKRYRLRFSLPTAAADGGVPFLVSPALVDNYDLLWIDDRVQEGMMLNHLILGPNPAFPLRLVLAGTFLIGLTLASRQLSSHWPLLLLIVGIAIVLSEYIWEQHLWAFWGHYWPDGYVSMAYGMNNWLSGQMTLSETLKFLSRAWNGCNFLIPLLIALLHGLGLPYIWGYTLLSVAFSVGTILVSTASLRKHWGLERDQLAFFVVLAGVNLVVIRGFARTLTDAGGMFFTTLFIAAFLSYVRENQNGRASWWAAILAASLGLFTRLALFPLLLVPVAFALWRWFFSRPPGGLMSLVRPLTVSLMATGLVVITFTGLHLWRSVAETRAFTLSEHFVSQFSLRPFATSTIFAIQLALPLAVLHARQIFSDERLVIPLIAILGFESMLFAGRIVPWVRYWAPIAPLACAITCALLFSQQHPSRTWQLVILGLLVTANLALFADTGGYWLTWG